MKVLFVNHLLDPVTGGGTAERTFQLSRAVATMGADCTILTLDIGITPLRLKALKPVKVLAVSCFNQRYFLPKVSLARIDDLVTDADIVHLSGHWTILNALIYRACARYRKPYVFCPAGALRPFGRSVLSKRFYDLVVGRSLACSAAACVAITEDERAEFKAYGVPEGKVVVIPNGINPGDYDHVSTKNSQQSFRLRHGLGSAPYILFLGRLSTIKGPDLLLEAFVLIAQRFPEVHLVFAGPDGGMLQQLKIETARLSFSSRIHFAGYIEGEEKADALSSALLLAIPSRREAMSIVVLEAGVCGAPVLFTDACGLAEMAEKSAGHMVDVSSQALAAGLSEMISGEVKTQEYARNLNSLVLARYTWRIQAERHMSVYLNVLAQIEGVPG